MLRVEDPVGPDNDRWLRESAARAGVIVAAWGKPGSHRDRDLEVMAMLPNLHYLQKNKDGSPGHPLYLPGHLTPVPMF